MTKLGSLGQPLHSSGLSRVVVAGRAWSLSRRSSLPISDLIWRTSRACGSCLSVTGLCAVASSNAARPEPARELKPVSRLLASSRNSLDSAVSSRAAGRRRNRRCATVVDIEQERDCTCARSDDDRTVITTPEACASHCRRSASDNNPVTGRGVYGCPRDPSLSSSALSDVRTADGRPRRPSKSGADRLRLRRAERKVARIAEARDSASELAVSTGGTSRRRPESRRATRLKHAWSTRRAAGIGLTTVIWT